MNHPAGLPNQTTEAARTGLLQFFSESSAHQAMQLPDGETRRDDVHLPDFREIERSWERARRTSTTDWMSDGFNRGALEDRGPRSSSIISMASRWEMGATRTETSPKTSTKILQADKNHGPNCSS